MNLGRSTQVILGIAGLLVALQVFNTLTANSLIPHGIAPRTISGLQGIAFAIFVHGSWAHLVSNLLPFVVLSWLVSTEGLGRYLRVAFLITLLGGLLVWLFGRSSIHVGASGLIFGLWTYLLARAWYQRSLGSVVVATVAFLGYSGLVFGFIPSDGVSFESHIAGAVAGVATAWLMHSRTLDSAAA